MLLKKTIFVLLSILYLLNSFFKMSVIFQLPCRWIFGRTWNLSQEAASLLIVISCRNWVARALSVMLKQIPRGVSTQQVFSYLVGTPLRMLRPTLARDIGAETRSTLRKRRPRSSYCKQPYYNYTDVDK